MTPRVAVAGPPNSGKTTLFNRLTGATHHVGNWPGQTIEQHSGGFEHHGDRFDLVDLPGTYGLVAVSAEEAITTAALIDDPPDVVLSVIDASNLDSGLHLVAQVAEAGLQQVVALNMADVAERRHLAIATDRLAAATGAPVVPTVARRGEGLAALRDAVAQVAAAEHQPVLIVDYGPIVESHLTRLVEEIIRTPGAAALGAARWLALQALAGDEATISRFEQVPGGRDVVASATEARRAVADVLGHDAGLALAERRHAWVRALIAETRTGEGDTPWSDRLDRMLTHRFVGLPVFLAVMWLALRLTADVSAPYVDWIDGVVGGPATRWATGLLGVVGLGGTWIEALAVHGILPGVGAVLAFVPVLFTLYLALALLEDSGYMARAAAVMDRAMRAIGLPGKAFLPLMVGFGCTVPAIYATRTLDSHRDRLLTGLLTPFMSCGARLPVYVLLAAVFFAGNRGTVVFGLYLLGIVVAALIGLVLGRTALREDDPVQFIMVLPEFRLPSARTVWSLVAVRTRAFIKGAGTMILAASVVVWLLLAIPVGGGGFADTEVEDSLFGAIGQVAAPLMAPAGLGEWEQAGALMSGFVAKEVVISTIVLLYDGEPSDSTTPPPGAWDDLGEIGREFIGATVDTLRAIPAVFGLELLAVSDDAPTELHTTIRRSFEEGSGGHGALAAMAFLVFVLLYTPCMAAVAALRHEFGIRWMWVSVLGQLAIAWLGAFAVFRTGLALGLG